MARCLHPTGRYCVVRRILQKLTSHLCGIPLWETRVTAQLCAWILHVWTRVLRECYATRPVTSLSVPARRCLRIASEEAEAAKRAEEEEAARREAEFQELKRKKMEELEKQLALVCSNSHSVAYIHHE